jgi:hypothetical protein
MTVRYKDMNEEQRREYHRAAAARYRAKNPEKCQARTKEWRENNRDRARAASRRWKEENLTPEMKAEYDRRAYLKNPGRYKANAMKRHAAKLERTPTWADLEAIKEFYMLCPEGYEVDHIVPLQGEVVSGLHVLHNLQYLPAAENRAKSNTWQP